MKRLTILVLTFGFMLLGIIRPAGATLIGDTVTSQHFWRSFSKPLYAAQSVTVEAGATDLMRPDLNIYSVDVEAENILIHFLSPGTFLTGSVNSLKITGLDDSTGNDLRNVSVNTNMTGWAAPRLSFSTHEVIFNWAGLTAYCDTVFTANLDFSLPTDGLQPVPEPATIFLLAAGFLGVLGRKTRHHLQACLRS